MTKFSKLLNYRTFSEVIIVGALFLLIFILTLSFKIKSKNKNRNFLLATFIRFFVRRRTHFGEQVLISLRKKVSYSNQSSIKRGVNALN